MPQIDIQQRRIALSVSEFAGFRQVIDGRTQSYRGKDPWRMRRGIAWHQAEHQALHDSNREGDSEHPIEASWQEQGWTFQLRGRVDQIEFPKAGTCLIREIKTVGTPLPVAVNDLQAIHADYFAQLATYMVLASVMPATADSDLKGELLFIEPASGIRQSCPLEPAQAKILFDQQLDHWLQFLHARERATLRRKSLQIKPAFAEWREGQEEVLVALQERSADSRPILLEAPTGFGKTGVILQYALEALKQQRFERILYLTSKSTGQLETLRQIQSMAADGLLILPMRNRREHAQDCFCKGGGDPRSCAEACTIANGGELDLLKPESLFENATFGVESARAIGAKLRICPYTLSRSLLPYADVWIGDYNYVFAPSGKGVFEDCPGFQPEHTLLIIDEAHNLPERVSSALELNLSAASLDNAIAAASDQGARWHDPTALPALASWLDEQQASNGLSLRALYELTDLLELVNNCLQRSAIPWDAIDLLSAECLGSLPQWLEQLHGEMDNWLCWAPERACLRLTCLDPSATIAAAIAPFAQTLMMSATLQPFDDFAQACGLGGNSYSRLQGSAPWRDGAYRVAIDARVDTRLKSRDKYYTVTAETLIACSNIDPQLPVAVFLPSYRYAEAVREYIGVLDPGLRVALQPRGETLAGQAEFIETALLMSDLLFLILGSGFAEGIDQLGGRVQRIVVVSPSLPEVNAVQAASMQRLIDLGCDRDNAFHQRYRIPGSRKIRQALGRVVRAPGQTAEVILHCKRFAEAESRQLFEPDYQAQAILKNNRDLLNWLAHS